MTLVQKIQMHASCGKKVDAAQVNNVWSIQVNCPAGHPAGTPVAELLDKCLVCPQRASNKTSLTLENKVDTLKGAEGVAMPSSMPALPVEAPSPPAGFPTPAILTEPVAAPVAAAPAALIPLPVFPPELPVVAPAAALPLPEVPPVWEAQPPALVMQMPPALELTTPQLQSTTAAMATMPPALPTAAPVAAAMPPALPVAQALVAASPALPPIEAVVLPGGLTLNSLEAGGVDLDAVLKSIPGLPFSGSSEGGFSSHKLADAKCWRLFYLKYILGMRSRNAKKSFQLGTLYHAVMAMRYGVSPERQWEPLERAAEAGLGDLAYKVKAMCMMQFEKFQLDEWKHWCVRAVEHNMMAWVPCRIGKKTVLVPLSCRADMILGLKRADEPHPAYAGPIPQGVYIEDHKCLHPNEELMLADGSIVTAAECLTRQKAQVHVAVVDRELPIVRGEAFAGDAKFTKMRTMEQVRVTTASGRELLVTANHPTLTESGWTPAGNLGVGQYVAVVRPRVTSCKDVWPNAAVEAIGYLIGDGSMVTGKVYFYTGREDLRVRFLQAVESLGDTCSKPHYKVGTSNASHYVRKGRLTSILEEGGLLGCNAHTKRIPLQLFTASDAQIGVLLAALWSTDGTVGFSQNKERRVLNIVYATVSEQLARDIQRLLWRLGIWATRHAFTKKVCCSEQYVFWYVTVSGQASKILFMNLIAPQMVLRGPIPLSERVEGARPERSKRADKGDCLPAVLLSRCLQADGIRKIGSAYLSSFQHQGGASRAQFEELGSLKEGYTRLLCESETRWDRIEALERLDPVEAVAITCAPSPVFLNADGIVSHNTTSALTYDLVEGFSMDHQFATECAIFKLGRHEEVFGPLRGVIVSIASTARKQPTFDDFVRVEAPMPSESLNTFITDELSPLVAEAYERISTPDIRGNERCWPTDRRQCVGRWGRCEMFEYCDRAAAVAYRIDQSRIITEDNLAKPPAGWKVPGSPEEALSPLAEAEPPKKAKKAPAADEPEVGILAEAILTQIETDPPPLPTLVRSNYLTPGHTFTSVSNQLTMALKAVYEPHAEKKTTFGLGGLEWRFQKTGVSWSDGDSRKGRVTWRAVATWICKHHWFNISTVLPA